MFNLSDPLELPELRVEFRAVGDDRQIERATAQRPGALIPFHGSSERKSPGFRGIVESAGIDDRPVQKIGARIVRVSVGVEDVGAEFSDREDQPIGRRAACKLVDSRIHFLRLTAEVDRLSDEGTLHAGVGIVRACLVRFTAGKTGNAERPAQSKTLVDFRIDPGFGTVQSRKPR